MKDFKLKTIGIIHSPFKEPKGVPIQSKAGKGIKGSIEVFKDFVAGLDGLTEFSYIYLLSFFHKAKKTKLKVVPYMDNRERGVFATRAPSRPNSIGLSIVKLINIKDNIIYIEDIDIIDGTPLLDIKPYVPKFDSRNPKKIGWLKNNIHKLSDTRDDGRFKK